MSARTRGLLGLTAVGVVVIVAVAFSGRVQQPGGPGPVTLQQAQVIATAPCALFNESEMAAATGGFFKDRNASLDGGVALCSYLGGGDSDIDVVEVKVIPAGGGIDLDQYLEELQVTAGAESTAVEGLGERALLIPLGVGELWVRDGDALFAVSVTRTGTVGDPDAAQTVMRTLLAKVRGTQPGSIGAPPATSQTPSP